jgi:hypothetical protein
MLDTGGTDVASRSMSAPDGKPLLSPGNEARWAELEAEKREALIPPPDTPVAELLRRGQQLSAQAGGLLRAIERADDSARS